MCQTNVRTDGRMHGHGPYSKCRAGMASRGKNCMRRFLARQTRKCKLQN